MCVAPQTPLWTGRPGPVPRRQGSACPLSLPVDCLAHHIIRCPSTDLLVQLVVTRAKRAVPFPLLGENTLVLSDVLCVRPASGSSDGALELACRVGDVYPNQMLDATARMYLYRWRSLDWCTAHPHSPPLTFHQLQVRVCARRAGAQCMIWLPHTAKLQLAGQPENQTACWGDAVRAC